METLRRLFLFICLIIICVLSVYAQVNKRDTLAKNQFTLGIGAANGFEKHIFNVQEDEAVKTAIAVNFSYTRFLDRNFGIGARVIGYTKTFNDLMVEDMQGRIYRPEFTLTVINLSAEGVYVFRVGKLQPYGSLFLGYTFGEVKSDETGTLKHNGISVGGAVGAGYLISKSWAVSLELNGILGRSDWEETPFLNSAGKELDPSMVSVMAGVSYLWGK